VKNPDKISKGIENALFKIKINMYDVDTDKSLLMIYKATNEKGIAYSTEA
jgi:hypothetical protein